MKDSQSIILCVLIFFGIGASQKVDRRLSGETRYASGNPNFLTTPDYSNLQVYLKPAPQGVDAIFGWRIPGGLGDGIRIIVIEDPADLNHEDFKPPFWYNGKEMDSKGSPDGDHGTSVLGELVAQHNKFGINGICPNAVYGLSEINDDLDIDTAIAASIDTAARHLRAGDVILIERFVRGPTASNIDYDCNPTQASSLPVEYSQPCFDAIKRATDKNIIVVENAGNGQVNLDDTLYHNLFNRKFRDSKAIMVAADDGGNLKPACSTNYGSRIDYFAQGRNIVTTGGGDLNGDNIDVHAKYTSGFSGTSGAAPIVAGVIVQIQGMRRKAGLRPFTAEELKRKIKGTPQAQGTTSRYLGIMPDLKSTMK